MNLFRTKAPTPEAGLDYPPDLQEQIWRKAKALGLNSAWGPAILLGVKHTLDKRIGRRSERNEKAEKAAKLHPLEYEMGLKIGKYIELESH